MHVINPRVEKSPKSPFFEIRYSERDGSRTRSRTLSTGCASRTEAQKVMFEWLSNLDTLKKANELPLVSELLDAYLKNATSRGVGETTGVCVRHLKRHLGALRLSAITSDSIADYKAERDVAGPTLRRELKALKAAINLGVLDRRITLADVPVFEMPPEGDPRTRYIPEEQEPAFYAAALAWQTNGRLSRLSRFVALALDTAARMEAILELTWDRVDLARGVIDYRVPGVVYKKKRRGVVPICRRLRPLLERAFEERTGAHVLDHAGDIDGDWKRFLATQEITVSIHDLRRTWCSIAVQNGVSFEDVAEVACDTVETIRRHYGHLDIRSKQRAVDHRWSE